MRQPEARLQRRIREALEKQVGGWWFKVHGGPFQQAGIPDLVGCVDGYFFAFEVKTDKGKPSPIQLHTIARIRTRGGACAHVVTTPQEAIDFVCQHLEQARSVSKGRR